MTSRSIYDEFHDPSYSGEYLNQYEYVVNQPAVEKAVLKFGTRVFIRDQGHSGWKLDRFLVEAKAKNPELTAAEVAVLRLYTGGMDRVWNYALREFVCGRQTLAEKWFVCLTALNSGIRKLASTDRRPSRYYRGVKETVDLRLPANFGLITDEDAVGGTEPGFMSTSTDLEVAMKSYALQDGCEGSVLMFQSMTISRGASLEFLSQFPEEKEFLYPFFTVLTPQQFSLEEEVVNNEHKARLHAEGKFIRFFKMAAEIFPLSPREEKIEFVTQKYHSPAARQRALVNAHLRRAALDGAVDAEYDLARQYLLGTNLLVPGDIRDALDILRKLVDEGHVEAATTLGVCYRDAIGGPSDCIEAVRCFETAVSRGSVEGKAALGHCYYHGTGGLVQDRQRAYELYREAAESQNATAQVNLGVFYRGDGDNELNRNWNEAFRNFMLAAEQNSAKGQFNVGVCYANGLGVPEKDMMKAIEFYTLAANQGHASAQFNLGQYHWREGNTHEAIRYYTMSADLGDAGSQYVLGTLYERGEGVAQDMIRSFTYYLLASQKNHIKALVSLGICYFEGNGTSRDVQLAIQYLTTAAVSNDTEAQYFLGTIYEDGIPEELEQDLNKAFEYYSQAAENCHGQALFKVGTWQR